MPRAIRESATANGMTPPAAIKPMGEEISEAAVIMAAAIPSSSVAVVGRQAQRAVPTAIDEGEDLRDRRILRAEWLHSVQPFGEYARAVKQLLIERTHRGKPLLGEFAPLHADNVQPLEAGILPVDEAERNHIAAHAANAADHHLRSDPGELVHCGQAADENEIADLAMAAERPGGRKNHVVADMAVVTDMAAVHEITTVADTGDATAGHGAGIHGNLFPDGAALADFEPGEFTAIAQ